MTMKKINSSKIITLQAVINTINVINSSIDESESIKVDKKPRLCLHTKAGIFIGEPKIFSEEEISESEIITFNEDKTQFHINSACIIKNAKDSLKDNVDDDCIIENYIICLKNAEFTNNGEKRICPEMLIFAEDVVAFSPCF